MIALLDRLNRGDKVAAARLLPLVYDELRRLAAHYLRGEKRGQTIQATELVHEAYLRIARGEHLKWQGLSHFKAIAAISMRRILVDRARKKATEIHGGGAERIQLEEQLAISAGNHNDLIALDEALTRLAELSPRQSRVVEMRFFGGLTVEQIAEVEQVFPRTIKEDWSLGRAWLHNQISKA